MPTLKKRLARLDTRCFSCSTNSDGRCRNLKPGRADVDAVLHRRLAGPQNVAGAPLAVHFGAPHSVGEGLPIAMRFSPGGYDLWLATQVIVVVMSIGFVIFVASLHIIGKVCTFNCYSSYGLRRPWTGKAARSTKITVAALQLRGQ